MEKKPLISIVTVTYNAENFIESTLKSVMDQTFKDYEHLIIDGSSRDSTLEIVSRYGRETLRLLSEPDKGIYDAMNKGIDMARGEYLLFLNAGDRFHSTDTLERYATEAKRGKDIIYGDTDIVDLEGKFLRKRHLSAPIILTEDSFSSGMLICHQAFMVKKDIAPRYDLEYRFSADYDWTIKCIKKTSPKDCQNLGLVTIDFLEGGTTKKNKIKSLLERFRIMSSHYGLLKTGFNHFLFIGRALSRRLGSGSN